MRILVTGGTGMVGRNLVEALSRSTHEVLAPRRAELDLLDAPRVVSYLRENKPDFVVHCAGTVGGIQANMARPVAFLLENLDIGRNVVMGAREAGIKRLVNLGSSCMYPRDGKNPLTENQVLQGEFEPTNEGYALAKVTVARLCEYVRRECPEFQFKTLIPCNLYGKYDNFNPSTSHMAAAVLCKLHDAVARGDAEVQIWGDGTARREFMFAGDLVDCIIRAVDHFESLPNLMNVGMGLDFSVKEYYEIAASIVGFRGRFVHDTSKPVGMRQKLVDCSLARQWGWSSATKLVDGLRQTYNFYLETRG